MSAPESIDGQHHRQPPVSGSFEENEPQPLSYASPETQHKYPPGFRQRRGRNWFCIGLNYAGYYVNRYNLSMAKTDFCRTFGFSNADYGLIQFGRSWSYAFGQFFNGLLSDRIGGRKAMAIGGYGTAVMNILFGLGWYYQAMGPVFGTLGWFVALRSIDGYLQAFGSPGFVKTNTAWFARVERGRFAGIFGFMINVGRFILNSIAPALLAGFTIWHYHSPPGSWQLMFFVPAGLVTVFTTIMLLAVRNTPEEVGYVGVVPRSSNDGDDGEPLPLGVVFRTIMSNKFVWLTAWAYFCTGVVRYGVDDWFPAYFRESRGVDLKSWAFQFVAWMIPIVATAGSIASGYVSDLFFQSRRSTVAAGLYFIETCIILMAAQAHSLAAVCTLLVLTAFTCNSTHSILGVAAPMDIGGRKMAGFAAGVIDSWQYIGAGVAALSIGRLIDHFGWGAWLYSMAGFGLLGCALMLVMRRLENHEDVAAHART